MHFVGKLICGSYKYKIVQKITNYVFISLIYRVLYTYKNLYYKLLECVKIAKIAYQISDSSIKRRW